MTVLVTGAAGFIGFHVCQALLARGDQVIGIDNLNDYYDVNLKRARLEQLEARNGFSFHLADIADYDAMRPCGPAKMKFTASSSFPPAIKSSICATP